jgi:hypothetical protein
MRVNALPVIVGALCDGDCVPVLLGFYCGKRAMALMEDVGDLRIRGKPADRLMNPHFR